MARPGHKQGLARFVKIDKAQVVPTRYSRIQMIAHKIQFNKCSQPPDIFERLIRHLFNGFLRGKSTPQRIGLSFQTLPHGETFFIPLRAPQMNTYAVLSREVERHRMSQDPLMNIRGVQMQFKLTAQQKLAGSNGRRTKMVNEIDISDINNNYCLAYNLLAGIQITRFRALRHHQHERAIDAWAQKTALKTKATRLLKAARCNLHKDGYDLNDVDEIQHVLNEFYPRQYQIVVVETASIVFKGPKARHQICLRLFDNHYTLLKNIATYFGVSFHLISLSIPFVQAQYFCIQCEKPAYRLAHNSTCDSFCRYCFRWGFEFPCENDESRIECDECQRSFPNMNCFNAHKLVPTRQNAKSICDLVRLCECGRINNSYFGHKCEFTVKQVDRVRDECEKCLVRHDPEYPEVCFIPPFEPKSE